MGGTGVYLCPSRDLDDNSDSPNQNWSQWGSTWLFGSYVYRFVDRDFGGATNPIAGQSLTRIADRFKCVGNCCFTTYASHKFSHHKLVGTNLLNLDGSVLWVNNVLAHCNINCMTNEFPTAQWPFNCYWDWTDNPI